MSRVQMLDDDKGHAAGFGHVGEKGFQRRESAGRATDANEGNGGGRVDRNGGVVARFVSRG